MHSCMRFLGCALRAQAVNTPFTALIKAKNADEAQLHRRRKWLAEGLGYLESAALAAEVPAARPEA